MSFRDTLRAMGAGWLYREQTQPAVRNAVQVGAARLRIWAARAMLWRWTAGRFTLRDGVELRFLGPRGTYWRARRLLGLGDDTLATRSGCSVTVSELPMPGALRVPSHVGVAVRLDRPLEEILAGYHKALRRRLRHGTLEASTRRVTAPDEIRTVDETMLRPYAAFRHGPYADHKPIEQVIAMARGSGRLHVLSIGGEDVGCRLGYPTMRGGRTYWVERRFGYPATVFTEPKILREVNSLNAFLGLEGAVRGGFDYYDMGLCTASPEDGNLVWKKRRGGAVRVDEGSPCFYVRVGDAPQFLWENPLFAVERGGVVLHIGVPAQTSGDAAAARFRGLRQRGLRRVYAHVGGAPDVTLLTALEGVFTAAGAPVEIVGALTTAPRPTGA